MGKTRDPAPGSRAGGGAARLIARDDLVARLDQAVARKVTVVCAPAGSGKTSLLRAWAARPGQARRVAFVPVRRDEQDAQAFWRALLNAVCGPPRMRSLAAARRRCQEAIALAESHGWGAAWMTAPAQVTLAAAMVWAGEFDQAEQRLQPAAAALQADGGPDTRLLLHQTTGMLMAARGRHREALEEFSAAERLHSQLEGPHATQVTGWMVATKARLGMAAEARAALAGLRDELAVAGELGNARAVICLTAGDPAGALDALRDALGGTAPVIGYTTLVEAELLAGLAYRALGDLRAAGQAAERALALAEADRLVLPFAMTGARELLEALPSHETAHAALLAEILDVLRGSPVTSGQDYAQQAEALSPGELRVLRYLPTNLSRDEIAAQLSVSVNTVSTHLRRIYAKLQVGDRSAAVRRARELRLIAPGRAPA